MKSVSHESLSSLQKSFLIIRNLERKLKDQLISTDSMEEIAVVGMACHLPGGIHTVNDFWNALLAGEDLVTNYSLLTRWQEMEQKEYLFNKCMPHAGLLDDITLFDNDFFHISPAEARYIDPQHRHLLMLAHKALADAGIPADKLKGSDTGVFTGISAFDYSLHIMQQDESLRINPYVCSGNSFSGASGRISYCLGLHGPCISIDTACSSSLVALHQAAASLRRNECNLALVSGANLILSPYLQASLTEAGMLSPDGRCKAFDDSANGYVRSEGCITVVLKRLSDAEKDGDRIYACIKGSAVAQDGASGGLTVPDPASQAKVIKHALAAAGMEADDIRFVETHGTGTPLGDPIEAEGLHLAFGERHNREKIVAGSVKSNFGHLEAAAGLAGFMKACLNVYHKQMPPSLHFNTPNHHIDWQQMPFHINAEKYLFSNDKKRIVGGVSSFGFTGTVAHCIVAEYQHTVVEKCIPPPDFQLKPHWLGKLPGPVVPTGYTVKWKEVELATDRKPENDMAYVYVETDGGTPAFQKTFLSGKNAFSIAIDHLCRLENIFSTQRYQQYCLVYDLSAWIEEDENDEYTLSAAFKHIIQLFQTLKTLSLSPGVILFITRQGLPVNGTAPLYALQHSLASFIRSASLELQSPAMLVLDIHNDLPDMNFINRYVQQSYFRETAFRNNKYWYPVISPATPVPPIKVTLDNEGTYLVTGGNGSLGEHIAVWLRDNGAGQVIITGRSANANHKNDRIIYKQLDVACEEDVKAFGKWLKSTSLPLKGIVHAAGTNSRCLLKDMTIDDMLQVGAPKINGIRYLSRHLPSDQLDFLVTYSSIAAIWGSAMLAHYAAANAYMDAFVLHLKTKGIPAATINWGPWKNSNMVLKDSNTTSLLEESGVLTVHADTVGKSYASLLGISQDQRIYVQLNQSRFLQMMEIRGAQSYWETLRGMQQQKPVTANNTATLPNLMLITDDAERASLIHHELVLLVKEVLVIPEEEEIDPARSFSDMGMDSILLLKFVERINKRLGTTITSNTIFNYPATGLLTTHINELSTPQPVTVIKTVKENLRYSYTEDMSDAELLKMINKEIQKYS
ncbi:type I polyketide synthase [[Flexibacter] sp. ATCC 35208]|uniref:type I polyketide synthase n=1 Tax=[Flexibacter] sp. ATCC 35208 TaxID=1936242 RepID=UPI0009CF19FB|nr:SDR family NAD(P)-dependent oxidoreductase [[Flexibacter] sp. ATCC 35208]OMP79234.1 hypothetical protein BW716_10260 [[Flexibacter] sp. ATCC 35208]